MRFDELQLGYQRSPEHTLALIRKPHWTDLPYMIRRIDCQEGLLCFSFAQELPDHSARITWWDRVRVQVNLGLTPSRWQPLSANWERRIRDARPELRSELLQVLPG